MTWTFYEYLRYFKDHLLPQVEKCIVPSKPIDKPLRQYLWVSSVDSLIKDKTLPARAADWIIPDHIYTFRWR